MELTAKFNPGQKVYYPHYLQPFLYSATGQRYYRCELHAGTIVQISLSSNGRPTYSVFKDGSITNYLGEDGMSDNETGGQAIIDAINKIIPEVHYTAEEYQKLQETELLKNTKNIKYPEIIDGLARAFSPLEPLAKGVNVKVNKKIFQAVQNKGPVKKKNTDKYGLPKKPKK